ncbi:MAG: hypothetical protein ACSLE9_19650 [Burkholderiaceae bacterium]
MSEKITQDSERAPSVNPTLMERLSKFVGAGADRPGFTARHPISHAVIGQMTDAVGDRNPIYSDEAFARGTIHKGVVAPPLWMFSWLMPGLQPEAEQPRLEDGTAYFNLAPSGQRRAVTERRTIRDELNDVLEEYGYVSPAVTNMSYTYHRYLRPGETPRFSSWIIDEISGPKLTKLGEGFFSTMRMNVFVGDELVATVRQRYLRSKPAARDTSKVANDSASASLLDPSAADDPVLRFGPALGRTTETLRFHEVKAGDVLPPLVVKISPTLVIAGALASQDYQDVHHDYHIIRRRGHPDIFTNMMTTSGLLGRYLTDWTGPEALVRGHELRLLRPNYPGDRMRLSGTVRAAELIDGRGLVTVDFIGINSLGKHTESNIVVELPTR